MSNGLHITKRKCLLWNHMDCCSFSFQNSKSPMGSKTLLIFWSLISLTNSSPFSRQSQKLLSPNPPHDYIQSPYVRVAANKPVHPPWATEEEEHAPEGDSRHRRSAGAFNVVESVCDSTSDWVEKESAEDMWGNPVHVIKNIQVGNAMMKQYFYETFCTAQTSSNQTCRGIDASAYTSKCETKHIWAYAQVRNHLNDIGWTHVKIRGSCNCALYRKEERLSSIWEDLKRRRR